MSGHSHARTVAHKKNIEDQKRGKMFSKIGRMIAVAAKDGTDPSINSKLKQALEEAKRFNMPKENIERALKRGSGGPGEEEILEEVCYEAFGPGGIALIIEGITDNKNRAMLEVKQILQKNNGKLANEGSLKWLFERKGIIEINAKFPMPNAKTKEELEMKIIEAGAEDIKWPKEEILEIQTKVEDLEKIKNNLIKQGFEVESSSLDWLAKEEIELPEKEKESCQKLFEELDENETVQNIYSNLKE